MNDQNPFELVMPQYYDGGGPEFSANIVFWASTSGVGTASKVAPGIIDNPALLTIRQRHGNSVVDCHSMEHCGVNSPGSPRRDVLAHRRRGTDNRWFTGVLVRQELRRDGKE